MDKGMQGRRHGVDWGGHVHPTFFQDRFSNSSKFDEKSWGGGHFSFSEIGTRFPSFSIQ